MSKHKCAKARQSYTEISAKVPQCKNCDHYVFSTLLHWTDERSKVCRLGDFGVNPEGTCREFAAKAV